MSTTLERLKLSSRLTEEVKWPDTEESVSLKVPTDQDLLDAGLAADRVYRAAEVKVGMENIREYEAERQTQILFRCVLDRETGKRLAHTVEEFRGMLTKGVRESLLNDLSSFQERVSPSIEKMTEQEFDELLTSVKKNAVQIISNVSNISLLRKLIITLASRQSS